MQQISLVDTFDPEKRSAVMRAIKSKDTKPEVLIRQMLHREGYRFRLHRKDFPGKPDLVFSSRRAVIFVHGCFWHQHKNCKRGRCPKSNLQYWKVKLDKNVKRDKAHRAALRKAGWRVLVVWECEIGSAGLLNKLKSFLDHCDM
jgi:DNA mismatch endonuclease (patch repair protein)